MPIQVEHITAIELVQHLKIALAKYERDYKRFCDLYGVNSGAAQELATLINTLQTAIHNILAENTKAMAAVGHAKK